MTQDPTQFTIIGGPSKYDLQASLFDSTASRPRPVDFYVEQNCRLRLELKVQMNCVKREDGSGESWCITGYVVSSSPVLSARNIEGYYSTKHRSGTLHAK